MRHYGYIHCSATFNQRADLIAAAEGLVIDCNPAFFCKVFEYGKVDIIIPFVYTKQFLRLHTKRKQRAKNKKAGKW